MILYLKNRFSTKIQQLKEITEGTKIIYVCIIALFLFRFVHQNLKFLLESKFIDLGYHYFYSTMVRLGLDLFDPDMIEKAKLLNPMRIAGGQAVYSPSYFVFFQPLTYIPFSLLSTLWLILSVTLVFISIATFLRYSNWNRSLLMVTFICILVFTYQPLYEDLGLGQNNSLLLILSVGLWLGFKKNIPWLSGLSIALMSFIKIQFGVLFLFTFLLGERRAFLYAFVFLLILFFAGMPQLGFEHYQKYFFALKNHTSKVAIDLNNLSLNAQWQRLLGNDKNQATITYFITSLIIFISVLLWSYRYKDKIPNENLIIVAIVMIPILSPNTEPHHLVVILLPLVFASVNVEHMKVGSKILFAISVVLIVSRYSWNRYALSSSLIFTIFLSLKIVGVLMLLIVLMKLGSEIKKNSKII